MPCHFSAIFTFINNYKYKIKYNNKYNNNKYNNNYFYILNLVFMPFHEVKTLKFQHLFFPQMLGDISIYFNIQLTAG